MELEMTFPASDPPASTKPCSGVTGPCTAARDGHYPRCPKLSPPPAETAGRVRGSVAISMPASGLLGGEISDPRRTFSFAFASRARGVALSRRRFGKYRNYGAEVQTRLPTGRTRCK